MTFELRPDDKKEPDTRGTGEESSKQNDSVLKICSQVCFVLFSILASPSVDVDMWYLT